MSLNRLDPNGLICYKEVCGFPKGDMIPGTYVQLYFGHQLLVLLTHDDFKLNPLGSLENT